MPGENRKNNLQVPSSFSTAYIQTPPPSILGTTTHVVVPHSLLLCIDGYSPERYRPPNSGWVKVVTALPCRFQISNEDRCLRDHRTKAAVPGVGGLAGQGDAMWTVFWGGLTCQTTAHHPSVPWSPGPIDPVFEK